ncbi:hypothetical protein D2T29_22605 [Sinirhodobacter populi]|uniref:Porin n=1 Tax=Paenirhodobacter populi TaxID=2306993 RepID=A0A443JWA7_9RHOB|nr:hypothetical protein [Sinirhodobacter populi]RWR24793.1 hypothetical protein D2T29_22605 [Sinirhodobacter populi]
MKLRFAASVAGFALLASSLTASAASIILGDFNVEQYVEATPRQGQVSSSEVYSPSAVKVGGYRSLSVTNADMVEVRERRGFGILFATWVR